MLMSIIFYLEFCINDKIFCLLLCGSISTYIYFIISLQFEFLVSRSDMKVELCWNYMELHSSSKQGQDMYETGSWNFWNLKEL